MVLRLNVDACYRKLRRILLNMKDLESHLIEKRQNILSICGRFVPQDVEIKFRKKRNRRVEILDIEFSSDNGNEDDNNDHVQSRPFLFPS
ncbi:hypothetical protein MKW92_017902 [Papaver armeniacum]|nr:hypothetical protein MKW92_017902 [Papaver armeniacum]